MDSFFHKLFNFQGETTDLYSQSREREVNIRYEFIYKSYFFDVIIIVKFQTLRCISYFLLSPALQKHQFHFYHILISKVQF